MKTIRILVLVALGLAAAVAVRGQGAAVDRVAAEPPWEEVSAQLERIADLLERLVDGRKMELITRRVEVTTARLAPVREELARLEARRREVVAERSEILERVEINADSVAAGELEISPEEADRFAAQAERMLSRIAADLRQAEDRIAQLEVELDAGRREIETWQAYLDRELSGL